MNRTGLALLLLWIALLLAPNLTLVLSNPWESQATPLLLLSLWVTAFLYAMVPRRWFLLLTYPLVMAGVVVLAADLLRSVNLLDLLAAAPSLQRAEVDDALRPYWTPLAVACAALLLPLALLWRAPELLRASTPARIAVLLSGASLAFAFPADTWLRAWPMALAQAALESQPRAGGDSPPDAANMLASPRNRLRSWNAQRTAAPAEPETYLLVIGESVRSDRVPGCGGRPQITRPASDSLLFCDVLSGSSHTHTSVPLLISREMPGSKDRVSSDPSFLNAFESVGFETYWLSVQEQSIAWPDARNQLFVNAEGQLDRDILLPRLDKALAKSRQRKLVVLHAYNAHAPYPVRYRAEAAPFRVDRRQLEDRLPTTASLDDWWNAYDNAVDESVRFVNALIDRLRQQPGQVFVVYTPDHGENLLDDPRGLLYHALKFPTRWDTRVPAVIWANTAWRQAHAGQWQQLAANRDRPLMHMDLVPTLLGAAGISYQEPRSLPLDLTARAVGPRIRITQVRAGVTADTQALDQAAGVTPR